MFPHSAQRPNSTAQQQASKHAAAHFGLLCINVATPQPNETLRSLAPHCFHPATPPCPAAPFLACARQRRAAHEASTVPVTGSGTHARRLAEKMKRGQQCKNREQNQLCVGRVRAAVGSAAVQAQQPLCAAADAPAATAGAAAGANSSVVCISLTGAHQHHLQQAEAHTHAHTFFENECSVRR